MATFTEFKWERYCGDEITQTGFLQAKSLHEAKHFVRLDADEKESLMSDWIDRGKNTAVLPISSTMYIALFPLTN